MITEGTSKFCTYNKTINIIKVTIDKYVPTFWPKNKMHNNISYRHMNTLRVLYLEWWR